MGLLGLEKGRLRLLCSDFSFDASMASDLYRMHLVAPASRVAFCPERAG